MKSTDKAISSSGTSFLAIHELVQKARQKLNHDAWDYIVGGTETETTLKRNRSSLDALAFRPRVLRDVSQIDLTTDFLGRSLRLPVLLAPVGSLELFSTNAAADSALAAAEFGVAHMLSSICTPGLEGVAQAAPDALRLFQLPSSNSAAPCLSAHSVPRETNSRYTSAGITLSLPCYF